MCIRDSNYNPLDFLAPVNQRNQRKKYNGFPNNHTEHLNTIQKIRTDPVSYTHLDVYKRQVLFPHLPAFGKNGDPALSLDDLSPQVIEIGRAHV